MKIDMSLSHHTLAKATRWVGVLMDILCPPFYHENVAEMVADEMDLILLNGAEEYEELNTPMGKVLRDYLRHLARRDHHSAYNYTLPLEEVRFGECGDSPNAVGGTTFTSTGVNDRGQYDVTVWVGGTPCARFWSDTPISGENYSIADRTPDRNPA